MSLPDKTLAEITLIGTGGGYGESIVIHLGNHNWVVVDSCRNPLTKECLPLAYLKGLGVNIATDVKLIVCTHWHDDHILGISEVFNESKNAEFCAATANDVYKFMQLLDLDYEKAEIEVSNSSTLEFGNCVDILNERGQYLKRAIPDRPLQLININPSTKSEVFSLSPSDFTMHRFDQELSTLMDEYQSAAKKIPAGTPNSKSVALFLRLGDHRAILGADLETTSNRNEGWYSILDNSLVLDQKSTLFKIPHHGSENGFCDELWASQLNKKTISKLTPYNKNQKLPETAMLHKYSTLSKELYMTTLVYSEKPKKRNREIEKILKRLKYKVREVKFQQGIVRCRIDLLDPNATWVVEPLFNARRIT
jgi:hypothetical protein